MARWSALPEAQRHEREAKGMAAWKQWAGDHAAAILEMGGPLSQTKLVNEAGISDIRNHMSAFTLVQADSRDAAARMFLNHPHFSLFPGDGVEIMEILPIPGS